MPPGRPPLAASLVCVLLALRAVSAVEPTLPEESWYALYIGEAKCGHVHSLIGRTEADPAVIRSKTTMQVTLTRMGQSVSASIDMSYDEDEEGRILGFAMDMKASGFPMSMRGTVKGDKLLLSAGNLPPQERPWDDAVIGPHEMRRRLLAAGVKPGTKLAFDTFSVEAFRKTRVTIEIKDLEDVDVLGKVQRLWRTEMRQDMMPGTVVVSWLDDRADIVKSNVSMLGMTMSHVRCTREHALGRGRPAEMFLSSGVVRVKRRVPDPRLVRQALYRIGFKNPEALKVDIEDDRQTIVKREGQVLELRVRSIGPPDAAPATPPARLAEYLRPTAYLQCTDPAIQAATRGALGDLKHPWQRAKRLERWVRQAVTEKGLSVGFAGAKETLESREGDCTEHSVLLAAMLRAAGIPSRVAFGLLYVNSPRTGGPVFGAHMWTEAWVGRWVALDATLADPLVDAMHIKLGGAALAGPTPGGEFLSLVHVLGQTSIEILSVNGETPATPNRPEP